MSGKKSNKFYSQITKHTENFHIFRQTKLRTELNLINCLKFQLVWTQRILWNRKRNHVQRSETLGVSPFNRPTTTKTTKKKKKCSQHVWKADQSNCVLLHFHRELIFFTGRKCSHSYWNTNFTTFIESRTSIYAWSCSNLLRALLQKTLSLSCLSLIYRSRAHLRVSVSHPSYSQGKWHDRISLLGFCVLYCDVWCLGWGFFFNVFG